MLCKIRKGHKMFTKYILPLKSHINRDLLIWTLIGLVATSSYTLLTNAYFPEMSPITSEVIGTFLSITCVGLITKQNLWCWPFGIVGVILLGYAFFVYGLISTAILHIAFFLPMQFHGWYQWLNNADNERKITSIGIVRAGVLMILVYLIPVLIWALFIPDIAGFLGDIVPQNPIADSAIMWFSIVAQTLMNYKVLENWIFWITLNVIAIFTYFTSGMIMVAVLYMFFMFIASNGLLEWSKVYNGGKK